MMMQGAAMGAGAAVGSSMVHGAMNMMSGSSDDKSAAPAQQHQVQYVQQAPAQTQFSGPCASQMQDFISCTQQNSDMNMCSAFNDIYQNCKRENGL